MVLKSLWYTIHSITLRSLKKQAVFLAQVIAVMYIVQLSYIYITRKAWNGVRMPVSQLMVQTLKRGTEYTVTPGDLAEHEINILDPWSGRSENFYNFTARIGSGEMIRGIDIGTLGWPGNHEFRHIKPMAYGEKRRMLIPARYMIYGTKMEEEEQINGEHQREVYIGNQYRHSVVEVTLWAITKSRTLRDQIEAEAEYKKRHANMTMFDSFEESVTAAASQIEQYGEPVADEKTEKTEDTEKAEKTEKTEKAEKTE